MPIPTTRASGVPAEVADVLSAETGIAFAGRVEEEVDVLLTVDRTRQRQAIACQASQATGNEVLRRGLALLADREALRWLRPTEDPPVRPVVT